jgi:hypothetical protein
MGELEPVNGSDWMTDINDNFSALDGNHYVKKYFVDNVSGAATNEGVSWDKPFAQPSQAVTAWEAFRALQPNIYGRGLILVRGTGTAYTALTALPNYCDIVGVGANPNGNGTGIAIIGANGADGISGTARGLGLKNLQIRYGGAGWGGDFVQLLRSTIEDCCFLCDTAAGEGGIRFTGASGGVTIRRCHWAGSGNVIAKVGIEIDGPNFNDCLIEDNQIHGTTAGILVADTCSTGQNGTAADNTIVKNNVIGDLGRGCAKGVDDNEILGMIVYAGNFIMATDAMEITEGGTRRCVGNHVINTTTGAVEVSGS